MAKKILKEATGVNAQNLKHDYDNDGVVTAADARLYDRMMSGLEPDLYNKYFPQTQPAAQTAQPVTQPVASQPVTQATQYVPVQQQTLTGAYMDQVNGYLDAYKNNKFHYDLYADPVYQQARDAAIRQGQLAMRDTAANAASLTGGYGNSYGATAAANAYNSYLQGLNDIVPDLQNAAYARYQDDQNRNLTLSQMYLDLENESYNRAWNEDERAYNRAWNEDERAYSREQDAYNRRYNLAQLGAQYGDYDGLNGLGIDTTEFENKQALDEAWEDEQRQWAREDRTTEEEARALNLALQKAQYGDYTALEDLGFDMSTQKNKDLMDKAMEFAEYGDYSLLKILGIDTALLEAQKAATMAGLYNKTSGGSSGGRSGGSKSGGNDKNTGTNEPDLTSLKTYALSMGYKILGQQNGVVIVQDQDGQTLYLEPEDEEKDKTKRSAYARSRSQTK